MTDTPDPFEMTALCRAGNHTPCPGRCDVPGHEWTCGCECHDYDDDHLLIGDEVIEP